MANRARMGKGKSWSKIPLQQSFWVDILPNPVPAWRDRQCGDPKSNGAGPGEPTAALMKGVWLNFNRMAPHRSSPPAD